VAGSTETVMSSSWPVFLKMVKPVTGHPFDAGSTQEIPMEVFVVDSTVGTSRPPGFRHAYTVAAVLLGDSPFKLCADTVNL
jgi:hypothetical protein